MPSWDTYSRRSVDLAAAASSLSLSAVKAGTRLGFSITRGLVTGAAGIPSTVVDHALFGGSTIVRPLVGGAISTLFFVMEQVSLAPIHLGEYMTSTSVLAAHSSINLLSLIFPGSSEASFSLASFINLVQREWNEPQHGDHLPVQKFGFTQIARATVAWVALQGVTHEWGEGQMLKHMRELYVCEPRKSSFLRTRKNSRVRVTSDVTLPNKSQIIAAEIGVASPSSRESFLSLRGSLGRAFSSNKITQIPSINNNELKTTLRRLSKLVLAGYGGASLLFFGVPLMPTSASSQPQKAAEEANLTTAINASEAEAAGDPTEVEPEQHYSWWDVLLGRHDQEIFETYANTSSTSAQEKRNADMRATAVVGVEHQMPRFWVLTDHERGQIVLILRGTMSLNEIAVDLTCEPTGFTPAVTADEDRHKTRQSMPGQFLFPSLDDKGQITSSTQTKQYLVHSGILKMANAMGGVGKPVHIAVQKALYNNPDYELILSGHSLGAGVSAILGLMWADPKTCLTVRSSGLPIGRQVSVYCFAPPCLTDAALTSLSSKLVTSFVYSHDIVSRLSLASVRNLKNAAMWLCEAQSKAEEGKGKDKAAGEGYEAVTERAKRWKDGRGLEDDDTWFISMRKTLEANMCWADTFPPGRVLWAMRDSDMHPAHRTSSSETEDKLRLFDVLDVEAVFSQILFAKDMLSAHMPHQYDKALHDLL